MKLKETLYLILSLFLIQSCSNTIEDPRYDLGSAYYPIQEGWYMIYNVDTTSIVSQDDDGVTTTSIIQLREEIGTPYDDGFGHQTYPIIRSKRLNETMEWELDSVWSLTFRNNQYVRYENAIPYLVLVNPFNINTTWDKNIYNNFEVPSSLSDTSFVSQVLSVGSSSVVNGAFYEDVAEVREINIGENATNISTVEQKVIYGRDLGLIKSSYISSQKDFFRVYNTDDELLSNPYTTEENWDQELITLGSGLQIRNPFHRDLIPTQTYNPISMNNVEGSNDFEKYTNIERWIEEWVNIPNSPIYSYGSITDRNTREITYIVHFYDPTIFNGFTGRDFSITQELIEYGISIKP